MMLSSVRQQPVFPTAVSFNVRTPVCSWLNLVFMSVPTCSSEGPLLRGDLQLRQHLRPVVRRPVGEMHVPPRLRGQSGEDGVRQRWEGLPQRVRAPPARLQEPEEHTSAVPGALRWALPSWDYFSSRLWHFLDSETNVGIRVCQEFRWGISLFILFSVRLEWKVSTTIALSPKITLLFFLDVFCWSPSPRSIYYLQLLLFLPHIPHLLTERLC